MKKPILVIQNCEIESPGVLGRYLDDKALPYTLVHAYKEEGLPVVDEVGMIIALGTPISVTDYRKHSYLVAEFDLLTRALRAGTPILGLCFGGQLLAHALGAKVQPNKVKEIGIRTVRLTDEGSADPLFKGFETEFPVFQWHGDTWRNPFGAEWLATSDDCKYQAFRQGTAVGLQFHLEADPEEIPAWCDAYAGELQEEGIAADDVIAGMREHADGMQVATYRLLDNYFAMAAAPVNDTP